MQAALDRNPTRGYLGTSAHIGTRGVMVIQYWASADDLYNFAHDTSTIHPAAWNAWFDRERANPRATGIWHETYVVPAGGIETVYDDMPLMGLADATGVIEVTPRSTTARQRLAGNR